jgi:hypothetical protein
MLVNDLLHEWDIGGGKAVISHLFRILHAVKRSNPQFSSILTTVDER